MIRNHSNNGSIYVNLFSALPNLIFVLNDNDVDLLPSWLKNTTTYNKNHIKNSAQHFTPLIENGVKIANPVLII